MPEPIIRQRERLVDLPGGGRALVVEADIPDDAPEAIQEGITRRALVNGGGQCPCGASALWPNRAERRAAARAGRVLHIEIDHEHDCPASDAVLVPRMRAWAGGRR
jgi:hypothetical protein